MITIVKIGGNVLDDASALAEFLQLFSQWNGPKILVHGGGKLATRTAQNMGIEAQMVDGRRITDQAMLDIVTMVYAGLTNKQVVAQLQANGCNALGLTGADANVIQANIRPKTPIDFGFVGDVTPDAVQATQVLKWLSNGITPVFSAITHDGNGQLLNTNADTIASCLAEALAQLADTQLIYCFEKKGVLRDAEDETTVIAEINASIFEQLKAEKIVHAGMLPKLSNALNAVAKGVKNVYIKQAKDLLDESTGTRIC